MSKVSVEKRIDASADRVWKIVADFGNVSVFNPLVERAELLSRNDRGLDAKRVCHLYNKKSAVEEIDEWQEGVGFTVSIIDAPMPLNNVKARLGVRSTGANTSVATMEMSYDPKYGPLGLLINALILKSAMRKMLSRVLTGLAHHTTTGELVGKGGKSEGTAVVRSRPVVNEL